MRDSYDQYLIVGGGKTGIDAVLYLLDHGVLPDKISWVVPNDSWLLNRDSLVFDENTISFYESYFEGLTNDNEKTWQDVYKR